MCLVYPRWWSSGLDCIVYEKTMSSQRVMRGFISQRRKYSCSMRAKQPISFKLANRGFLPAETTDLHKHIWNLAKIAQISSLQLPTLVSAQCPANRTKGSQGPQTRSRAAYLSHSKLIPTISQVWGRVRCFRWDFNLPRNKTLADLAPCMFLHKAVFLEGVKEAGYIEQPTPCLIVIFATSNLCIFAIFASFPFIAGEWLLPSLLRLQSVNQVTTMAFTTMTLAAANSLQLTHVELELTTRQGAKAENNLKDLDSTKS